MTKSIALANSPNPNSIPASRLVDLSITNQEISNSAAIAQSKLDLAISNSEVTSNAAIDSSKLSYSPGLTSTVSRTVKERFLDEVSVKDFGAKGDGTTDDSSSIQAAIDSLAQGGRVYFPNGTYKVNTALNITKSNVLLDLGKAKIDATGLTGWTLAGGSGFDNGRALASINIVGSLILTTSVTTASLPVGIYQFDLTSVTGVQIGDLIHIDTNEPWYGTAGKTMIARIIWISGSTITIDRPIEYSISPGTYTTTVQIIRPVENSNVVGGYVYGGGLVDPALLNGFGPCGVRMEGCVNCGVQETEIKFFQNRALEIAFCYNSYATDVYMQGLPNSVDPNQPGLSTGTGGLSSFYGVFIGRCCGIVTHNIRGTLVRHLIDGADSNRVTVSDCITTRTHASAYTTHSGSTDWLFTNCVADQTYHYGMQWRGFNLDVRNCFFFSANPTGGLYGFTDVADNPTDPAKRISIQNSVIVGGIRSVYIRGNSEVDIRGCKLIQNGTGTAGPVQISSRKLPRFLFKNNTVQSSTSTRAIQVIDGGTDGDVLIFDGNFFEYILSGGVYLESIVIQRTSGSIPNSALNIIAKENVLPGSTTQVVQYNYRTGGIFVDTPNYGI